MRGRLGIPEEAFVIGHVGRFHEQKNHEFLLATMQAAVAICPDAHCLMIGDGPLHGAIRRRSIAAGCRITLHS